LSRRRLWQTKLDDLIPGELYFDYSRATVNTLPRVIRIKRIEGGSVYFETLDGAEHRTYRYYHIAPLSDRQVLTGLRQRRKHTLRRIEKWTNHIDDIDALIAQVESLQKGGDA
jgi:hypothetical protein